MVSPWFAHLQVGKTVANVQCYVYVTQLCECDFPSGTIKLKFVVSHCWKSCVHHWEDMLFNLKGLVKPVKKIFMLKAAQAHTTVSLLHFYKR